MAETKPSNDSRIDTEIQVHLTEYQKIRDEIVHQIGNASQSLLLSLSSSSIVLPILFSQINNMPPIILGSFLYVLTIVYAVIGMHYATAQYFVNVESNYIHQSLAPKINLRLHTTSKNRVLQAENFQRSVRRNVVALYLSSAGAIATGIIILLPSLLSLLFAQYALLLPAAQTLQPTLAFQFLSSFILPLSIAAWIFFIFSCLSQLLTVVYTGMTSFIMHESDDK